MTISIEQLMQALEDGREILVTINGEYYELINL